MLSDKIICVIGAGGLLGRALVRAILDRGGKALLADASTKALESLKSEFASDITRLGFIEVDITSKDSLENCFQEGVKLFGRIDGAVNTAYPRNANYGALLEDVTYQDFCENTDLHLGGYFLTMQVFAKEFAKQGHGSLVNLSSIYGVIAPKFEVYDGTEMTMPVEYAAIKSGLIHLTQYFAKYYKGRRVRFNCVSPGGIENGQDESFLKAYHRFCLNKGMLDARDLGGAVCFLLSEDSLRINGQNLIVDDGFTL